jgi:hypothetical protein
MGQDLQETNDLFNNRHESICQVLLVDFKDGKRDEYLGAFYWVHDDTNMDYPGN